MEQTCSQPNRNRTEPFTNILQYKNVANSGTSVQRS